MEEIRRIAGELGIRTVIFPDTSNVLNRPQTGKFEMYPKGGVTVGALVSTGESKATVALGRTASWPAARALDVKCNVHCELLELPIGLTATDSFIDTLRNDCGGERPRFDQHRAWAACST